MNNCLVTKLKSVVENDNLRYFDTLRMTWYVQNYTGEKRLPIKYYSEDFISLGGAGIILTPVENCHVVNGNNEIIEIDGKYTFIGNEGFSVMIKPIDDTKSCKFLMSGLSHITKLLSYEGRQANLYLSCDDVDSIKYFANNIEIKPHLYFLATAGTTEENPTIIDYIPYLDPNQVLNATYVSKSFNSTVKFSLSDAARFTNLIELGLTKSSGWITDGDVSSISSMKLAHVFLDGQTTVTGDITSFGSMTDLVELRIWNTKITGSVEEFVAAQVAAGRTNGVVKIWNANGKVTFNGSNVSEGHHNIQWTSASNIIVGNEYLPDE